MTFCYGGPRKLRRVATENIVEPPELAFVRGSAHFPRLASAEMHLPQTLAWAVFIFGLRSRSSPWLQAVSLACDLISLYPEWDKYLPLASMLEPRAYQSWDFSPAYHLHFHPISRSQTYLCCFWTSYVFFGFSFLYFINYFVHFKCRG